MAVIKVNGRVIEVPKVLLAYGSHDFNPEKLRGEHIGRLDVRKSGLEERLHNLTIDDKSVVGFHRTTDGGFGRFDVDVLVPGIHVREDNNSFSFAYLIKGRPVLRREDDQDFEIRNINPYYNVEMELGPYFLGYFGLHEEMVRLYDGKSRFIGLVNRNRVVNVSGISGDDILSIGKCRVTPGSGFLDDFFDMKHAVNGVVNTRSEQPHVSLVLYYGNIFLDLDYATNVLGLGFKDQILSEGSSERTMITAPHSDIKYDDARAGEIDAVQRIIPEVRSEPAVVVDVDNFFPREEEAVPAALEAVQVEEGLGGLDEEIDLDAEILTTTRSGAFQVVEGGGVQEQTGQPEVVLDKFKPELPLKRDDLGEGVSLEAKVDKEINYFEALRTAREKGEAVDTILDEWVHHYVGVKDYESAIRLAKECSNKEFLLYACMSACDDAMNRKAYVLAAAYANASDNPEYVEDIKREIVSRLDEKDPRAGYIFLQIGDKERALDCFEKTRMFSYAIPLARELGDKERLRILLKKARPLGELRLSIENVLESNVVPKLKTLRDGLVKRTKDVGKSFGSFGKTLSTNYESVNWNKTGRSALIVGLSLAFGYGLYNFATLPPQTRDEKEAWESARELRQSGDLNGAAIYAKRAHAAMRLHERFWYGLPGIDSDYEDFANKVLSELEDKKRLEGRMLVDYPVSTDDPDWLAGYLDNPRPIEPQKKALASRRVSSLEGTTKRLLKTFFGLSFREGDPYTSAFEGEVRKYYKDYVTKNGEISSGSFRFVYVVEGGVLSKAVLVRDGDGSALSFGKSLLGSMRGRKVSASDGVYASNLYKFGGKAK